MATAGRILIMPKGAYDASATYEMLDLVKHNGVAWIAKKTATGIEPSDANSEYWHNVIDLEAKKENFNVVAPEGVTYIRQNCYKVGNKVHIEFSSIAPKYMASSETWALIPSKYAPKESTGYTGIFTSNLNGFVINTCACYALPPSDSEYANVFQSVEHIDEGKYVGFMFDYYLD